ncbi:MAG: hypothetical protein RI897_155 [Verrucomicrobiota bacterium]|jgi:hypothetical protein
MLSVSRRRRRLESLVEEIRLVSVARFMTSILFLLTYVRGGSGVAGAVLCSLGKERNLHR